MAQIDEMTLMAFADGELPEEEAARVAAVLETDPALQAELNKHLRLNAEIMTAFSGYYSITCAGKTAENCAIRAP